MREVLVAVFDTEDHTNKAVTALTAAGISSSAIRRYNRTDPEVQFTGPPATETAPEPRRQSAGFWSWLLGEDTGTTNWRSDHEQDYASYRQAMQEGRNVLAVFVDDVDCDRIMNVLAAQSPRELEASGPAGNTQLGENVGPTPTAGGVPPAGATPRVRRYRIDPAS